MERLKPDSLQRYQRGILGVYLKRLSYRGEVELYAFSFASDDESRRATVLTARMHLPCDDDSSLWCMGTLGIQGHAASEHEHQFVSTLDTDSLDAVEWVASTYHYDRYVERLGHGHTLPLPAGGRMARHGYAGTLVLEGGFYGHFTTDLGKISGTNTSLFAVLPLTESEVVRKRERGLEEVLADWERTGRDMLHFDG